MKKLKIGLLGCSKICIPAVINAVKQLEGVEVYGCAAGQYERAGEYMGRYGIPYAFKNYGELLDCNEIDIIYISLANNLHYKWVIETINHKKHILLEKPMCLCYEEALEIERIMNQNQVHILEAVMVQHHSWQDFIKDFMLQGKYGSLKSIKSIISFIPQDNFKGSYRENPAMGGGCFFDLSTYWLQFLQYLLGLNYKTLKAYSDFSGPNGCDWNFDAFLAYDCGVEAQLEASFEKPHQAYHALEFEKGRLVVKDFFRCIFGSTKFYMEEEDFISGDKNKISLPAQNFYVNQLAFFCDVIRGAKKNIELKESIERVRVMEEIMISAKSRSLKGAKNEKSN